MKIVDKEFFRQLKANAVGLQRDGKIVAAGYANPGAKERAASRSGCSAIGRIYHDLYRPEQS
jgi:hypothetical protein